MTILQKTFLSFLKRPPVLLVIFAVFFGNILFTFWITASQKNKINMLETAIEDMRDNNKFAGFSPEQKANAEVAMFMRRLPDNGKLTSVLRDIIGSARKNGLNVQEGSYAPQTDMRGDISKYTINFPVEGRYSNIKKFIYDVETLRQILTIEDIALVKGSSEKGIVKLTIKISVYYSI